MNIIHGIVAFVGAQHAVPLPTIYNEDATLQRGIDG